MCRGPDDGLRYPGLLRDPLIRLMMKSDGVTEGEMIELMGQLRRALAVREHCICSDSCEQAPDL
jgi:hypothetical protein